MEESVDCDRKIFSVGIVTYNNEDTIMSTLNSLENLSNRNEIEIFVLDNHSTDRTAIIIEQNYKDVRLIRNRDNIGFGRANNLIIEKVNTEYYVLVNPDIVVKPDTFYHIRKFMEQNADIVQMSPKVLNEDGTEQFLPKKYPKLKYMAAGKLENRSDFFKKLRSEYTMRNRKAENIADIGFCTGCFSVLRTRELKQCGGFDERFFLYLEDADLTRKMQEYGRTVYNPQIIVTHKWERTSGKSLKYFLIHFQSMLKYMWKWRKDNRKVGKICRKTNIKAEYGLGEWIQNFIAFFYTKINYRNARLVRYPFYCRGKKFFHYGRGFTVGYGCRFEMFHAGHLKIHGRIIVGNNCKFGDRVHITACEEVRIGNNCLAASNILISDNEHGTYRGKEQSSPLEIPDQRKIYIQKVRIGNNVWIGENVVILPGVTLGDGCVIGANSVVKSSFADNTMVAGAPAAAVKIWKKEQGGWIKCR